MTVLYSIQSGLKDLFHLLLPNNCSGCGNGLVSGEDMICSDCILELPRTNFHLYKKSPIEKILWGRVHYQKITSWMHFTKGGLVQRLLYELKYNNNQALGFKLGEMLAYNLLDSGFFESMDLLIPIPLHHKKQFHRGYNQSELIANGISSVTNVKVDTQVVKRIIANPTQTRKSRISRWDNVSDIMQVINESELQNKHVLLIDDVITTGSTIEAMTDVMESIPGIRISILTLCWAGDE